MKQRLDKLSLGTLKCVHEVIKTGSMSLAARNLGISQPAVSKQITRFEGILGAPIILRNGNQLATRPGAPADFVFEVSHALEVLLQRSQTSSVSAPRVGICTSLSEYFISLGARLDDVSRRFNVSLSDHVSLELLFKGGALDCVILPCKRSTDISDSVYTVAHSWVASRPWTEDYPAANGCFPAVMPLSSSPHFDAVLEYLTSRRLKPQIIAQICDLSAGLGIAERGLGAVLVPHSKVSNLPAALNELEALRGQHVNLQYEVVSNAKAISGLQKAWLAETLGLQTEDDYSYSLEEKEEWEHSLIIE